MPGEQFGKFRLLKKLATGGMGELFLARHVDWPADAEPVVLKRILPHLGKNPEFVKRFMQEAKIAARFEHKNLVKVLDFGKEDNIYFMTMKYFPGRNLQEVLHDLEKRQDIWDYECAIYIVLEILDGLSYIHSMSDKGGGFVHLDLNPANIQIGPKGEIKILDFGLAEAFGFGANNNIDGQKSQCGTPAYMSPEQCKGKKLDTRSDIYSAGVILYEAATLAKLFPNGPSDPSVMTAIAEGEISKPSLVKEEFPAELEEIILRALKLKSQRRYTTAKDFSNKLKSFSRKHNYNVGAARLTQALRKLSSDSEEDKAKRKEARSNRDRSGVLSAFSPQTKTESIVPSVSEFMGVKRGLLERAEQEEQKRNLNIAYFAFGVILALLLAVFSLMYAKRVGVIERDTNGDYIPKYGKIYIQTDPPGARLMVSSRKIDQPTPVSIDQIELDREVEVEIFLEGYEPELRRLKLSRKSRLEALLVELEPQEKE